jgi:hypothetical protein
MQLEHNIEIITRIQYSITDNDLISSFNEDAMLMRYALFLAIGARFLPPANARARARALPEESALSFAKKSIDNPGMPERPRLFYCGGVFLF